MGCWKFNNDSTVGENYSSSNLIYDYSPSHSFNGTFVFKNFNSTGGYLGDGANEFNKTNYIVLSNSTVFSPDKNGNVSTFSIWIKMNNDTSGTGSNARQFIFGKGGAGGEYEYELYRSNSSSSASIVFQWWDGPVSATSNLLTLFNGWIPDTWYHIAIVLNGTSEIGYVNGIKTNSVTLTKVHDGNTNHTLVLGDRLISTGTFNGSIDEFIYWNRSLSSNEIWNFYNNYVTTGCYNLTERGVTFSGPATLCRGTFNYNGTANGAWTINEDNVNIDCNGSTIYGNETTSRNVALYAINSQKSNYTLRNCIFQNYSRALVSTSSTQVYNHNYTNITVYKPAVAIFCIRTTNCTMSNIYTYDGINITTIIDIEHSTNVKVTNSVFNMTRNVGFFWVDNTTNLEISNNYMFNISSLPTGAPNSYDMVFRNSSHILVKNNIIDGSDHNLVLTGVANNITYRDNTIKNSWGHNDIYDVGFSAQNDRNQPSSSQNFSFINFINNTFEDFGCIGIQTRDTFYFTIINNTFTQNYTNLLTKNYDCDNEPMTAILISQIYKGYVPTGTLAGDAYAFITAHQSDNGVISGNTFTNVNVPLRIQGRYTNITHDLTNVWFKSFQLPYLSDRNDFWISNLFNNLTNIEPAFTLNNMMKEGIAPGSNFTLNYTFTNQYEYYKNIKNFNYQLNLYNKSNALVTLSNNSVACSVISSCDGNINLTLTPGNSSYVFDEANITENVNPRPNFPLNLTGSSTFLSQDFNRKTYTFTSTLSDAITIPFIANTQCPQTGDTITLNGVTQSYSCPSANQVQFTLTGFNTANSNLVITYNGDPQGAGGGGGGGGGTGDDDVPTTDLNKTDEPECTYQMNRSILWGAYSMDTSLNFLNIPTELITCSNSKYWGRVLSLDKTNDGFTIRGLKLWILSIPLLSLFLTWLIIDIKKTNKLIRRTKK